MVIYSYIYINLTVFVFCCRLKMGKTYLTEETVPVVMESVLEKLDFR